MIENQTIYKHLRNVDSLIIQLTNIENVVLGDKLVD
jgi:hypothetical protein